MRMDQPRQTLYIPKASDEEISQAIAARGLDKLLDYLMGEANEIWSDAAPAGCFLLFTDTSRGDLGATIG